MLSKNQGSCREDALAALCGICLEFFSRRSIIINEFVSSLQQRRAVAAA